MPEPLNYRPSNSAVYYTPPAQLDIFRTVVGFSIGAIVVVLGAAIYAQIQPNLSSPLFRAGELGVATIVLGAVGMAAARFGKVCSPVIAAFIGASLGVLYLYVIWLVWIHRLLNLGIRRFGWEPLIVHPVVLYQIIARIERFGVWSYHGDTVRGIPLLILWIGEACILLAGAVFLPIKGFSSDEIACKECGRACKSAQRLPRFATDRQPDFIASIERRDFPAILTHEAPKSDNDPEIAMRLVSCPRCLGTNVLTVNRLAWGAYKNGVRRLITTPLVNRLLVTQEELEQIKSLGNLVFQQREAAETTESELDANAHAETTPPPEKSG